MTPTKPDQTYLFAKLKAMGLTLALVLFVVLGIPSLFYLDFHIWRLVHPQAPTWTFFFSR